MEGDLDDPWYPRQLGRTGEGEREEEGRARRTGEEQVAGAESASGGKRKAKRRKPGAESGCERGGGMRERTRIKRRKSGRGRGGGGTLKRRTFPHEPPKMRPGIVEPEPPMPRS